MKIGIITGSHRESSQSEKVGRYAAARLSEEQLCQETFVFSLAGNPLPLWDEGIGGGDQKWEQALGELGEQLSSCDAFVIVAPEWHGMVPAGLKNFFLLFSGGEVLSHKPALIVSVSGGSGGGAYPIAELRSSSYKNCRICYLPEHLIVRNAAEVFNHDPADNDDTSHKYLDARLDYCLEMLSEYADAFKTIRASGKVSLETYKNGM